MLCLLVHAPPCSLLLLLQVLGKSGEKMDDDMVAVLEKDGPEGLSKLLAKRYKAEHKGGIR
jgi:hypothetical protein